MEKEGDGSQLFQETERRETAMRNRDTGQLSAAERIELLNEILIRQGLSSVLPKKKNRFRGSHTDIKTNRRQEE
jgi:hypothetical protein